MDNIYQPTFNLAEPTEKSYHVDWNIKTTEKLKEYYKENVHASSNIHDAGFFLMGYISLMDRVVDIKYVRGRVYKHLATYRDYGFELDSVAEECSTSIYNMNKLLRDKTSLSDKMVTVMYFKLFPEDEEYMWLDVEDKKNN